MNCDSNCNCSFSTGGYFFASKIRRKVKDSNLVCQKKTGFRIDKIKSNVYFENLFLNLNLHEPVTQKITMLNTITNDVC